MYSESFYNELITDHNKNPLHKKALEGANFTLEGVNPSCGDDIILEFKVEDDIIKDGAFVGDGCAISQASADIMIDMVTGKTKEEATHLANQFMKMIRGDATDEEVEELEEAGVLQNIAHMPSRVKCAVLGWRTLNEMFAEDEAKS